jgi:negative regulator of flagellin synthesis FlgM
MSISQLNAQQSLRASMAIAAMRSNTAAAKTAPTSGATRQPDAVSLSDTARALSAATKSVGDTADVREDRVSAIKAAIANGTYSVNSRQLARSMVKNLAG